MRLVTQIGRAVLAAGVAALAWAPAAPAGTYDVVACNGAAAGGVNKSWAYGLGDLRGFRPESPAADPVNFNNLGDCDTGIVARSAAGDPQRETGFGTSASLSFAAAPGTSIVGVVITRYGEARPSADDPNTEDPEDAVWDVFAQDGKDGSVIGGEFGGEVCRTQAGGPMCTVGAPGGSTSRKHDLPRSPRITWGVGCGGPKPANCFTNAGPSFGFYPLASFVFHGATVTIEDNDRPAGVGVAGTFTTEGWHKSTDTLRVAGRDASGIEEVRVAVDGVPLKEVARDCDFAEEKPCSDASGTVIDLRDGRFAVGDGDHVAQITLLDAAGNPATVEQRVRIDENGPLLSVRRPEGATIVADASDSASGLASAQVETRTLPDGGYVPVETRIESGQVVGRAAGDAGRLGIRITVRDTAGNATVVEGVPSSLDITRARVGRRARAIRRGRVKVRATQAVRLSGVLRGADGRPLGGRQVAVTAALRREGAAAMPITTVTTAGDGTFGVRVPAGASRLVRLAFEGGGGALPNSRGVSLRVPASSRIRASRRFLRGGGRVRFSGRLRAAGQPVPRGGKLVELQAFDRGRWRTFASTRARGATAAWKQSYRFGGRRGRYPIRARIRRESTFPFELGYSPRVVVRVR